MSSATPYSNLFLLFVLAELPERPRFPCIASPVVLFPKLTHAQASVARFNPTYETRFITGVIWKIPENPRAILHIAHGRFLNIFSFFDRSPECELGYGLPEDRAIVLEALDRKYAVIVVKSVGYEWISWPVETSQDKACVTSVVTQWVEEHGFG